MRKHDSAHEDDDDYGEVVTVALDEVFVSEKTWERLLRKDAGQIKRLRLDYEAGRQMVRVILRRRCSGGYDIEDGRHRIIAAKLAGEAFIDAIIVGD